MTERNRVTPLSEIVRTPLRGAWTGNRGCLHEGHEIRRFHTGNLWITCTLQYKGRWNEQWQPRHYTYLFFHDEAVSLAAGHRPCAECRRASYNEYRSAWSDVTGRPLPSAHDLNVRLHAERLHRGTHRRRLHAAAFPDLPDGAFVLDDETPWLVLGRELVAWRPSGYAERRPRPRIGAAVAITPPTSLDALRSGYPVQIDDAAR